MELLYMKKLTEYLKKYGWWALVLLIVMIFAFQKCKINKLEDNLQLKNVELSTLNDSVSVFKDKNKNLTFKIAAVEVDAGNRKKALEEAGFEIKDLKDRNIKWRDLVIALQAEIESAGHGSTVLHDTLIITKTDTIKQSNFNWNNRYLFLSGNVIEKKIDFTYKYKTGIDIVNTRQGKDNLVSVYLSDPNAVVLTSNSIVIKRRIYFWEKPWITIPAGIVGGILIMKL